jgi:hypothetical protein
MTLASQAAEALKRAVADKSPQEAPKPPPSGTTARRSFIKNRGW